MITPRKLALLFWRMAIAFSSWGAPARRFGSAWKVSVFLADTPLDGPPDLQRHRKGVA